MRESEIERYLVRKTKQHGGEVRKVKWIGHRGAPDRIVMLPHGTWWVELKAPGQKPKLHQVREHQRMARMGQRILVIDSIHQIDLLFYKEE